MSKLRGLRGALAVGMFAVGAGSGTAALVPLGRPQLPIPSADWALVAAVTGAALIGLFGIQTALIALIARRPLRDAVRATTGSFSPLLLLWPLLLGVTFSDTANHWFVYHPGLGLWWGGVGFVFAVAQIALLPMQLDGGISWRAPRTLTLRRRTPSAIVGVAVGVSVLHLTVLLAFETAPRIDPVPAYQPFYSLATLTDQGVYPFLGRWSEYPPAFPWLSSGVYRAVSFFGVTFERYSIAITLALLPFSAGVAILVYRLADLAWGPQRAFFAVWAYTMLGIPLFVWMRTFSALGVFFLLAAVLLSIHDRRASAAAALAVGFLVKIIPAAAVVLLLRYARTWPERLKVIGVGLLVTAAVAGPLWMAGGRWFEASIANWLARPPWQTPWALLDGHLGPGLLTQGWLNPDFATTYGYQGTLPGWVWMLPPTVFFAFATLVLLRPSPASDARTQIRLAFLMILALLLAFKGWSPAFVSWVLPLVVIVYPDLRGLAIGAALGAMEIFWRPLALQLGWGDAAVITVVTARTLLFLALGAAMQRAVWDPACPPAAGRQRT